MSAETSDAAEPGSEEVPDGGLLLDQRYSIFEDAPIPALDLAGARAFQARDSRNPGRSIFARICEPGVYPRLSVMEHVKAMREANILAPLHWGVVDLAREPRQAFAVVFDRPEGEPLMSPQGRMLAIKTDDVCHVVLHPLVPTLLVLAQRRFPHRAIRPENVYVKREGGRSVYLGDCVSTPPAWGQSAAFESLESAMTPRCARGAGSVTDDLYALGATILFLAIGQNPVAGMSDEAIVASKLANGSFAALLNGARPPLGLRELLRGLLTDEPEDRWSIEDVEQWLGGITRRTAHPKTELKSDRPFDFAGKEYRHCRNLAIAFGDSWQDGMVAMRSPSFANWLKRGLPEESVFEDIETEVDTFEPLAPNADSDPVTLSRVCMILDPVGPVRYKGSVAMPDGVGFALADAMRRGDRNEVRTLSEMVSRDLTLRWYKNHEFDPHFDAVMETKRLKRFGQLLKHRAAGYGVERLMYELGPDLPCLSPIFEKEYVCKVQDVLPALERAAARTGALPSLADRHLTAFVAARFRGNLELQFSALERGKNDPLSTKLAVLTILALLQFEYGPEAVPHLSQLFAKDIEGLADRFHSRTLRDRVRGKLEAIGGAGRLADLANIFNNPARLRRDKANRDEAERKYADAERRIRMLQSQEFQESAQKLGWSIASGISAGVALLTIATVAVW